VARILSTALLALLLLSCRIAAADDARPRRALALGYVETLRGGAGVADLNYAALDVIAHGFLFPDADGRVLESPNFERYRREGIVERAHRAKKRIVASVGGATLSGSFAAVAASPEKRGALVKGLLAEVRACGYDGVDVDWEFPAAADRAGFTALLRELHRAFKDASPDLVVMFGTSPGYFLDSYDFPALAAASDYAVCMGYDWNNPANGPMTSAARQWTAGGSVIEASARGALDLILERGYPAEKLLLGIPLYSPARAPAPARSWFEVRERWLALDPAPEAASREALIDGAYWNTPRAIRAKLEAVLTRDGSVLAGGAVIGGVAVWELGHEGAAHDLTDAIRTWLDAH
jgi:hypothetical protein